MTSLPEWQAKVKSFNDDRDWSLPWCTKDLLLNVVEETGEAWNVLKWVTEAKTAELVAKGKDEWEDYVGQMLYLSIKMAYLHGVDAEKALARTMEEFEQRFPVAKSKGSHSNRRAGGHDGKYEED